MLRLPSETEILIVGAGPTGLALAAELHRRGAAPVIIDREPAGANTSRACVVHARTLEVLDEVGVTKDLLAQGLKTPIFRIRDRDHTLMTIDFSEIGSPYPFTLMIPQDRVERILLGHLEGLSGAVVRPCELSVRNRDRSAQAQVRISGVDHAIEARWVIGCDGMHSVMREQAGVAFDGGEYEQGFVLADVKMHWPLSREEVTLFYSPRGLVVVAPLPEDHFRIVATMDNRPKTHPLNSCNRFSTNGVRRKGRGGFALSCGVRGFTSTTGSLRARRRAAYYSAGMPRMCIVPRVGRA